MKRYGTGAIIFFGLFLFQTWMVIFGNRFPTNDLSQYPNKIVVVERTKIERFQSYRNEHFDLAIYTNKGDRFHINSPTSSALIEPQSKIFIQSEYLVHYLIGSFLDEPGTVVNISKNGKNIVGVNEQISEQTEKNKVGAFVSIIYFIVASTFLFYWVDANKKILVTLKRTRQLK